MDPVKLLIAREFEYPDWSLKYIWIIIRKKKIELRTIKKKRVNAKEVKGIWINIKKKSVLYTKNENAKLIRTIRNNNYDFHIIESLSSFLFFVL